MDIIYKENKSDSFSFNDMYIYTSLLTGWMKNNTIQVCLSLLRTLNIGLRVRNIFIGIGPEIETKRYIVEVVNNKCLNHTKLIG